MRRIKVVSEDDSKPSSWAPRSWNGCFTGVTGGRESLDASMQF